MSRLQQVKASAGSGKTYQLTRTFLELLDGAKDTSSPYVCTGALRQGYTWPEIMAVTFTNKAAAEMKERVIHTLKEAALALGNSDDYPCSSATARKAVNNVLRRYHRLNIRTIDSLLALLLRLFALNFGIRPDFQMLFKETEMLEAVFARFTAKCENDALAHERLSIATETTARNESKKGFWIDDAIRNYLFDLTGFLISHPSAKAVETDQDTIRALLTKAQSDLQGAIGAMESYLADNNLPANANFIKCLTKLGQRELFELLPAKDSAFVEKASLRDCVNAKGKDKVDDTGETIYCQFKDAWQQYKTDFSTLSNAYFLGPVVEIAMELLDELGALQRQHGVILGSALAGYVSELLAGGDAVSEAYCRLGCRLHHLLIDEFQDTDRDQWKAVTPLAQECLSKGGSLFYVGDVKQAIYAWRGGDSALFDEVMRQPDLAPLADQTDTEVLPDNWRSYENIVRFNNDFFKNLELSFQAVELTERIFPDADRAFQDDFARDLAENFLESSQGISPRTIGTGGYVRFTMLDGSNKDEIETASIAELERLMDELSQRHSYKDIAVLVRTHGHADIVCDLLVRKNIPVITENSLQLDKHPVIRQIIGLLAFLDYPRDDIGFVTFTSGQECFLAETGMSATAYQDWLVQPKKRPLGVHFREEFPDHWERFIAPFFDEAGLMTPYDLTQEALRIFRVLERHPESELYIRRFLEVIHLAEENGYGSLPTFLEYWQQNSSDEKVPLPENIDAVRIMTIHKSKGLEFPVVIIPFHNWSIRQDSEFTVQTVAGKRFLTPLRKGVGKPYQTSMGRAAREQLNLLYVAWTRAVKELHGFFVPGNASNPACKAMEAFLDLDANDVFKLGTPVEGTARAHQELPATKAQLGPIDGPVELINRLPRLRVHRHNRDEYFYNERVRGEVAHRALELLRFLENDVAERERAVKLSMQEFTILDSLDEAERTRLAEELDDMVAWAQSQTNLRDWLAQGEREPEVMTGDGEFKRFDLLVRGKETIVIDFKTGSPTEHNQEQVREYMAILSDMTPGAQVSGYLVYLDLHEIRAVEAC